MAEQNKLELKISLNDQGWQEFENQGVEAAQTLNKSFSELDSTIMKLNNNSSSFNQYLKLINSNKLTLNDSFYELEKTFNDLNDSSLKFGQSLNILMKDGSTFGDSINQSAEQASEQIANLEEEVKDTNSLFDKIGNFFDNLIVKIVGGISTIYVLINGLRSFNENLLSVLKFLNNPVGTIKNVYKSYKDEIIPLIEKSKKIIDLVRTHRKEIAATLGISALWTAIVAEVGLIIASFVGMTVGQLLILAGATTLFVLAVTGQFELMGKALDSVYNNYLAPFFENLNKDTEDYTKIIDEANKAFESAFPMPTEPPARTPDPGLRLELEPVDPKIWEQLEREREERKLNNEEIKKGNELINQQSNILDINTGALASAKGEMSAYALGQGYMSDATHGAMVDAIALRKQGIDPLTGGTKEADKAVLDLASSYEAGAVVFGHVVDKVGGANEALGTLNSTTGDLSARSKELADEQENVTQAVADGSAVMDNAGASAEQFGEALAQVESSGGFFDGIKQGFIDFVENVESNSELMADFFANTLTEMSQNFSDLFYNVLTGKFDNLQDLAKQAFEAILRAFLDMVAAIATRQIVISIAGAIGIGTKGASATDYLGLGKQAVGLGGDLAGMFSGGAGGAALGGSAALGGGISAIGAGAGAAGGATSVGASLGLSGISSVGTVPTGGAATFGLGGISSIPAAGPGFLSAALPWVGAVLAAAAIAYTFLSPLLKKTPRLDIDFDSIKTEAGRRAAVVSEILDEDFFTEDIAQISVKRKAGLGVGGNDRIKEIIQEKLEETIEGIQDIIAKLPTEMFRELNETLLNADIDIDTVIAGERLLEFDAKGKKIAEKFQAFIEGELPAKFFASIRESFFDPAFQALGVSAEGTQALIDDFMTKMEAAGSREARAEVGAEFIATFGAFVDAFNIVSGNVNDSIGQTIQSVNNLSAKLGFDAVPSIDELRKTLGEMIENAEIDPETVQAYADLRNAIVSLMAEITSTITGLIGKINQLNTTIVSLGGSAVDTTGFLNTAASQIQDFLGVNMGNLSLSEQEGFLDQLLGVANDMLAQEQAAFEQAQQAAREAAERAAEAERAAVQQRIDGLNAEKERIEEAFNARIEALNEELRIAEGFAQLTESIRQTLDSILYSPESVLTGIEQVNALQGNVAALQQELAGTTDPKRQMEIAGRLEEAFKTLFGAAGDAFGVNSPEFVAIFDQVTGGLSGLAEMTESRARTVEEINAEIERLTAEQNNQLASIDAKIQAAQDQLSAIGTQEVEATFQASDRVKELFEYIRTEYMRILEERFAQLEEASITGFATELEGLQTIAGISEESLVTMKEQLSATAEQTELLRRVAEAFENLGEFNGGSGGLRDFGRGTLAVLHGKEAVVTEAQVRAMKKHMTLAAEMTGGLGGALETFAESLEGAGPITGIGELAGAVRLTELVDRAGSARMTSIMEEFAGMNAGGAVGGFAERLAEKLAGEDGVVSGASRRAAIEGVKNEMSVAISVNVNGGSGATVASVGNEIENMLVRSIKQGGRLRSAIQEAGAKRMG